MTVIKLYFACLFLLLLTGCEELRHSSKYNFADGYYYSRLHSKKTERYYVVAGGDSVKLYPATLKKITDTVKSLTIVFPPEQKPSPVRRYSLRSQSFDLDFITIFFKYRPTVQGFPNQLNSTFNGAIYSGYRTDIYKLTYKDTPLQIAKRKISHHGYSIGGFIGMGTARIDEYVTLNRINYEYDGAVVSTGFAAEFGFNKVNFGLTYGFDFLTDRNKHVWVNQAKPWLGLGVGLNLN